MEVVRSFNNELSSLYEVKPPISKAKMTQITKSAIKGIKFYKHIVQSVEKFIQKCRPEYKVPGLYVVDSIVRQSRHQFGPDKDVFGPRFVKNITVTFQHLFKCAEDDRPKIIRVLNLWQKNAVFPIEVIQPLLDMGHPNTSADSYALNDDAQLSRHKGTDSTSWKGWNQNNDESAQDNRTYAEMSTKNLEKFTKAEMANSVDDEVSRSSLYRNQSKLEKPPEETVKFNKKLLDFDYGDEEDEEEIKNDDSHLSTQPNALALSMAQNLLSNPELLRQLQQMQQTIQQTEALKSELAMQPQHVTKSEDNEASYGDSHHSPQQPLLPSAVYQQPVLSHKLQLAQTETDKDDRIIAEPPLPPQDLDERSLASIMVSHDRLLPSVCLAAYQQTGVPPNVPLTHGEADKDDRVIPDPSIPPRDLDERSLASIMAPPDRGVLPPMSYTEASMMPYQYDKNSIPYPQQQQLPLMEPMAMDATYPSVVSSDQHLLQNTQGDEDERVMYSMPGEPPLPPQDFDERTLMVPVEDRSRKERSRSRSGSRTRGRSGRHRSRSRSPRRKRSRSRSHSRKNRSRSRERERIREKERERERERERRRKGIPPVKKGCVSVCSTTLWLGHVPKSCSEVDISNTFGPYGTILSIDMIPPRGCAYVVMDRRQDGYRALQKLKNLKLQGSSIKMAWAPGKGVKGKEYKDYWEVDLGVSYVPFEKIPEDAEALDLLEEGGFIDEESLPEHLKALRKQPDEEKGSFSTNNKVGLETSTTFNEVQAPPNMVPPPIMPPTSVSLPMVMPHLMQPQYGLHLSGLLPPQAMVIPMGIPPPNPMLMVQQQSQNILSNQPLPIVGGVPQMVPRTVPPVPVALQNLKSTVHSEPVLSSPMVSAAAAGDATPTEEDGTSVSSPSVVHMSAPCSVSTSSVPVASTQTGVSLPQFNHAVGLPNALHSANRPMISVPPPVSAAGTPIPYPPPNVGFNFPPPGLRPPVQAPNPNPQFQWMQKPSNSPYAEAESNQSINSVVSRPMVPQSGMPHHMFGVRHPFPDPSSTSMQSSIKEAHSMKRGDNLPEMKSSDIDGLGNRNVSPVHHDKMLQEMVISTDDESSMDHDYSRNDAPMGGPRFQGPNEFPRGPMNVQRMRPPGPMQGPRFPPRGMHMGAPFPMRMGGPRGMGGPIMHPRMEMEFPGHSGPRGPRLPGGPHVPHRNDNIHPPHDGRDWYPRDFDGPPFERERDRHYHDDWNRESWVTPEELENDTRRIPRDRDEGRRDESRDSWNRDGHTQPGSSRDNDQRDMSYADRNDSVGRQKQRITGKPKVNKSLMDDMFKLRFYQRDKKPDFYSKFGKKDFSENRSEQFKEKQGQKQNGNEDKKDIEKDKNEIYTDNKSNDGNLCEKELLDDHSQSGQSTVVSKREKDRESRKRSRWGRTLSEEREFQQQKRNEIEMKFQSYEQSHAAQQPVANVGENTVPKNPEESTPVSEVLTPASEALTPASEALTPASEALTPASEAFTPASEAFTPASEAFTPASETLTPASEAFTPVSEILTPASEALPPASEILTPTFEILTPASEILTPASEILTEMTPLSEMLTESKEVINSLVSATTECDNVSTLNMSTAGNAVAEPDMTENNSKNCLSEPNENVNDLSTINEAPCDSISEANEISNNNNETTSPLVSAES